MKDKLFPLRLNELLDDAPQFSPRAHAFCRLSCIFIQHGRHPQSQIIQLSIHSIARAATHNFTRFKLSAAAQHLTPELTRAKREAYNMSARKEHEKNAIEASGSMSC